MKISFCTTLKNRSNIIYKSSDLQPNELQQFIHIERVLQIVQHENIGNVNFTTIKDKFKMPFTYTFDCIDSILKCIETNARLQKDNYEFIISDWHSTDCDLTKDIKVKYSNINKNINFKIIQHKEKNIKFSRGKGLNIAANNATGDILFFIDVDLLFNNTYMLEECINEVKKGKSAWPVCYKSMDPVSYRLYPEWAGYGICAMTKTDFMKYGPWPEYNKWGKEDLHLYQRFLRDNTHIFRKAYLGYIHQWHAEITRTREYKK
jgi:hypothetical protein